MLLHTSLSRQGGACTGDPTPHSIDLLVLRSGKYGVKAIWMDESEPDHKGYISGGQWDLYAGTDAEVLPAWVHCAPLSS